MKTFRVKVKYMVYETYTVKAKDRQEAEELITMGMYEPDTYDTDTFIFEDSDNGNQ